MSLQRTEIHKDGIETIEDSHDEAQPAAAAARQKTTWQMVAFSSFIALAGWIFNFDLGKLTRHCLSLNASSDDDLSRLWRHRSPDGILQKVLWPLWTQD